jgi:hypothetical protein
MLICWISLQQMSGQENKDLKKEGYEIRPPWWVEFGNSK